MQPRSYQSASVDSAFREWESGKRTTLIQIPTGAGKTKCGAMCAERFAERGKRTLFIVHLREIVRQARDEMHRMTSLPVGLELSNEKSSTLDPEPIICASVQTLNGQGRLQKFDPEEFGLIIADECFPGQTEVEGKRIDEIRVGDILSSGRVKHVFKKKCRKLLRFVFTSGKELICTPNHPIFDGMNFKRAELFERGDMMLTTTQFNEIQLRYLRSRDSQEIQYAAQVVRETRMSFSDDARTDRSDVQEARRRDYSLSKDEWHVEAGSPSEGINNATGNGLETRKARWKRERPNDLSSGPRFGVRMGNGIGGSNSNGKGKRLSNVLQIRRWKQRLENWNRDRWIFAFGLRKKRAGQKEDPIFGVDRVASITVHESGRGDGFEQMCSDGFVYNLEVENSHVYLANGIVVHNCHHLPAETWQRVFRYFPNAKILCLTATPERGDKKKIGATAKEGEVRVESIAYQYTLKQACDDGYLVKPRQLTIEIPGLDFTKIPRKKGDYSTEELNAIMIRYAKSCAHRSIEAIFDLYPHELDAVEESQWNEYVGDRPAKKSLIFCVTRLHAEKVMNALNSFREGLCGYVDGETPHVERRDTFRNFKHGELACLANCGVTTEGYDNPNIRNILMMRPSMSKSLFLQMIGRGSRTLKGTLDGIDSSEERLSAIANSEKPFCTVVDFTDNSRDHRLVTVLDIFGEDQPKSVRREFEKRAKDKAVDVEQEIKLILKERYELGHSQFDEAEIDGFTGKRKKKRKKLTPEQRRARADRPISGAGMEMLRKQKLNPEGRTVEENRALLREMKHRRLAGLCTYPQGFTLQKFGYTKEELKVMKFREASSLIDKIAANGWRPIPRTESSFTDRMIHETEEDYEFGQPAF